MAIIYKDFNSNNPLWDSERQIARGKLLKDFCAANDVLIVKDSSSLFPITFQRGVSLLWTDLKMTRFVHRN